MTLGGLRLEGSDFTRPKPLLLLCYLALQGPRHRGPLATLFFAESQHPRDALSTSLHRLRQLGEGLVVIEDDLVRTEVTCDAIRFAEAFDAGRLEAALELYRGSFLAGVELSLGEELEEWIYRTREMLADRVRRALLRLGEGDAARGSFEIATERAERAYLQPGAPEPDREDFRRIYRLLQAGGSALAGEVRKEAATFGISLALERDEAKRQLAEIAGEHRVAKDNPYRGLAPFREEDAELFFGRDDVIDELRLVVERRPLAAVLGSSGSGKSSLVFAGLIPRLRRQGGWRIAASRPGRRPLRALASTLLTLLEPGLGPADHVLESRKLTTRLADGDLVLSEIVEQILRQDPDRRLLLVIDQFEELFSIVPSELPGVDDDPAESGRGVRESFLQQILEAARFADDRFRLVLMIRADFMSRVLDFRPLVEPLQSGQLLLGPLSEAQQREAVERPALLRGVRFEEGLVDRILADVAGGDAGLPLLQFALEKLWEQEHGNWLTHRAYDAIGGVDRALARHADHTLAALGEAEGAVAQRVFLQLVQPGEGQEDTRRVATREEIGEQHWLLVSRLASARLVVTGRDEDGVQIAEIIHEALIRSWGVLRGWIDEHREFRMWQERLRPEVRVWLSRDRDEAALLRGYYLEEAEQKLAIYRDQLSAAERDFVEASGEQRDRELAERAAEQKRLFELEVERTRQFRRLSLVLLGLFVVAAIAAAAAIDRQRFAQGQRILAETHALLARARELSAQGQAAFEEDPALGLRLAVEGLMLVPERDERTLIALFATVRELSAFGRLAKLGGDIERVISPGDPPFVILDRRAGPGEIAALFDGRRLATLSGLIDRVWTSPDGSSLVIDYLDAADEVRSGADLATSAVLAGPVGEIEYGPGGSLFLVTYADADAVSEVRASADPGTSVVLSDRIDEMWWSPDGSFFVVDYGDGRSEVRASADPGTSVVLSDRIDEVWWSPDGSFFVVDYGDGRSEVRASADPGVPVVLSGGIGEVWWSPDGSFFVMDYPGLRGEMRASADPGARVVLSDGIGGLWWSPDGSFFVVDYHGSVSEIRRVEDPGVPIKLPTRVLKTRFGPGGSPIFLQYLGADSEIRFVTELGTPATLSGRVDGWWLSPDRSLLVVDYRDTAPEIRSVGDLARPIPLPGEVVDVDFHAGGRLFALQYEAGGTEIRLVGDPGTPIEMPGSISAAWLSPDEAWLIVSFGDADREFGVSELLAVARPDSPIGLHDHVAEVVFAPGGSWFLVRYADAASEIRSVADPAVPTARLAGVVVDVAIGPDASLVYVLYADGDSEIWDMTSTPSRIAALGLGLANTIFSRAGDRIVTLYSDGRAYLLDRDWLQAASRGPIHSAASLVDLACRGPLAIAPPDPVGLASFLAEGGSQACEMD